MAYLADLLVRKVFRTIRVSFLYVGHTHEDIDQLFSRIAVALRKTNAPTIDEFAKVIENSYTPQPKVIVLKSLANVSHGVLDMVSRFPKGIMKYKQFWLSMSDEGFPRLACRVHPHGSELFRAMDGNDMFTRIYDEHVGPWQGIDYTKIPPAQRKEPPLTDKDIEKYKKTISRAHQQWKLTEKQVQSLVEMLQTLANDEPIPFHWTTESIIVNPRLEAVQQPLPCENELELFDDESAPTPAAFDAWDVKQTAKHDSDPLKPFKIADLIAVNNGNAVTDPDPFFLAEIVSIDDPPDWRKVSGAAEGDWLVQIRWYDKAYNSKRKHLGWKEAKYQKQTGAKQLEWITKKSILTTLEKGLTSLGKIRASDYKNLEFYLKHPEVALEQTFQDQNGKDVEPEDPQKGEDELEDPKKNAAGGDDEDADEDSGSSTESLSESPVSGTKSVEKIDDELDSDENAINAELGIDEYASFADALETQPLFTTSILEEHSQSPNSRQRSARSENKSGHKTPIRTRRRARAQVQVATSKASLNRTTSASIVSSVGRPRTRRSIFDSDEGYAYLATEELKM